MMRKLNVGVDSFLFCNVLSLYSIVSSTAEDGALVVALYAGAQRFMLLWWCRCLAIGVYRRILLLHFHKEMKRNRFDFCISPNCHLLSSLTLRCALIIVSMSCRCRIRIGTYFGFVT